MDGKTGKAGINYQDYAGGIHSLSGRKAGIWLQSGGTEGVADRIQKWNDCSAADNLTVDSLKNVLVSSWNESFCVTSLHDTGMAIRVGKDEAALLAKCMDSKVGDVFLKSHIEVSAGDCVATVMPALSPKRAKQLGTYWQTQQQLVGTD